MIRLAVCRSSLLACFAALTVLPAFSQSVTINPTSVSFGNQAQGTASAVHKLTLKNGQSSAITISSISTNLADFSQTNNCPVTLPTLGTCTISITFTPSAQGTRSGTLTVVDSGLSSPQLASLTGTGTAPLLQSIAVTPSTASVAAGNTQQFTATGTYSDRSTQDLTTTASWSSSNTSVATVKLHTGLATSVAAGTVTITATSGTITGSATLTVTAAVLTSIAVTPSTASVAAGNKQQFTATGTYSNGTTQNLTTATWKSSASSVATISSAGLATGVAAGTATITASSGTISGSATLTVTAAVLTSIAVTPKTASVAAGKTQQFTATGTYSNGTTQVLTGTATWTSSATSIATVSTAGLATTLAAGSATITATSGTISGSATVTVTAAVLSSIAVTPGTASVAAGYTQQFTATGTYSNGTIQDLTTTASWSSSNTSVATIKLHTGLATSVGPGTATVSATSGSIKGTATLTVTAAVLTAIAVTPGTASVAAGYTQQFTATGMYSNGTTQNLTSTATWTSWATSVATVSSSGLATSVAQGSATVTATSGTISGSAVLTVTPALLTSLTVSPASASIANGTSLQFSATGKYSDNSTQDLTNAVTWTSSSTSIATIVTGGLATGAGLGTTMITATSGSVTGSVTLTVGQPTMVSIAVTPANQSFALGTTQQLTATATYSDGSTLDVTNSVTWGSVNGNIATVASTGLASSVAVGSTTVTATSGVITGSTSLTVTAAVLVSIAVTPAVPTLPLGSTQQFTATGSYTNGSTQNITGTVQWSSDTSTVATMSSTTAGLASTMGEGTATISATFGSVSGSTTLTVTAAALVSIAITPPMPSIAKGTAQQFTATGTYTDGKTRDLTSTAIWTSDTIATATVNSAGLAQSVTVGTTNITATSGTISNSTQLTVTEAMLVSITIDPPTATVPKGATQQFTAKGTYTDGSTQDLTQGGHWSSSSAGVATISNTTGTAGVASTLATGTTTIGISSGSVSAAATLVVNPAALASIAISPLNPTIALGTTQQFTATGTYTDGNTQDVTSLVTWSSSDATVAIISNAVGSYGLATSSGQGAATISAALNSISASTTITVTGPALVSIAITPNTATIPAGLSQQFTATGTYTDGISQDLTTSATWASSSPATASVSATGLVITSLVGSANITASSGSVTGSASVVVTTPVLVSLTVSPLTASIAKGTSQQFTATGTYSNNTIQDLTSSVNWTSSVTAVATIDASGLATGAGIGPSSIAANLGSVLASATLTVGQATLVSLAVTPVNPSFVLGTTQQFTATGTYSDGGTLDLTKSANWGTLDNSIATIDNAGLATSAAVGSTTATATSGAITGSTTLTITPAVLVSIAVTPALPSLPLGTTQQFTATGTYTDRSTQNITGSVQWNSDTPTVATISNDGSTAGLASSVSDGAATITATSGSVSGSTTLTVTAATLVSIAITPATPSIALGTTQQFTATGTYTDRKTQDLTSTAIWTSDDTATATINQVGLAQSVTTGTVNITATSGVISSSTQLAVTTAALVSIAIDPQASTIPLGATQQFTAMGTFTNGTTQDLTQSGHWSSADGTVATISNTVGTAGLASTLKAGTTTININSGSVSGTATLVVNPAALASIGISPQSPTIALGTTQQFTASGTYTDGSMGDVTSVVTWSSSNAGVAIISNAVGSYGLATSSGQGTATISATSNSISASTTITVGQASLISIAVSPASISIALGYGEQFSATATYSDNSILDVTQTATWTSSVPAVAVINTSGYATSMYPGSTTISATSGSVTGTSSLLVNAAVAISLAVTPSTSSVFVGAQQQFTATLRYSDGSSMDVTNSVTWSSLNPSVASVSGTGLAVGIANGSGAIEATWGANLLTATGTLTVSAPTVSITPVAASIGLSATQQFTATVTGNANQSVAWNVDGIPGGNTTIGAISTAGLYIAPPLIGSHNITAVAQANSASVGTATLTVGSLVPVQNSFFGMHLHLYASPVPNTMAGTGRIWDSASAQWPYLHTSMNTFVWTNLDNVLAAYKTAGINDVLYTLWRVPTWASSNPTDATCDYAASLGSKYYGECDLPTDINADGTGTNLTWRTWVQNIAQHVNSASYLATHARIAYWEPCNECYRSPTLDPGYGTGGAQVAYKGTYNQLVRLMQDARCIIVGNPNDPITALNTSCGQAGYPVIGIDPTAHMVMPSTNPIQVGKNNPSYPQVMQNLLYCTCANNSCSASITGCTSGSAGSAAVDIISTHLYPSTYTPEQIPSQVAKVRAYLGPTDLAKPLWNGEGGWGQNTTSTQVGNGDPDMEAAFLARFEVMTWASGIIRSYWYEWDNTSYGTLWSATSKNGCSVSFGSGYICKAGTAYQQVHDWLLGSTLGACSVTGTIWTCSLTQSNGSQAEIIWDTSQTCSNGNCNTTQQSVPSIYLHYSDLSGASYSANGMVPVGIKPILLTK